MHVDSTLEPLGVEPSGSVCPVHQQTFTEVPVTALDHLPQGVTDWVMTDWMPGLFRASVCPVCQAKTLLPFIYTKFAAYLCHLWLLGNSFLHFLNAIGWKDTTLSVKTLWRGHSESYPSNLNITLCFILLIHCLTIYFCSCKMCSGNLYRCISQYLLNTKWQSSHAAREADCSLRSSVINLKSNIWLQISF